MSFVRPSDESVFGGSIKIREPAEVRARELRRQAAWGFSGRSEVGLQGNLLLMFECIVVRRCEITGLE